MDGADRAPRDGSSVSGVPIPRYDRHQHNFRHVIRPID
jgi:hypothetical protein